MAGEYALIDAGDEGRLERFGDVTVARPAPAAVGPRRDPGAWTSADAIFAPTGAPTGGTWSLHAPLPDPWLVSIDGLTLELAPTEAGQVGCFPEHAPAWSWLAARVHERLPEPLARLPAVAVLHLFAYTGGATLAAAAAGARVAHVDSSRPAVAWARRNADRSGLAARPIRWLVDDAAAFVAREGRRGRTYDAIVLDPPTYGHGPSGRPWRIEDGLGPLLAACLSVLRQDGCLLVTAHTTGLAPADLAERLAESAAARGRRRGTVSSGDLALVARSGSHLPLGCWAVLDGPPLT